MPTIDESGDHPLRGICTGWLGKIEAAQKSKCKFQEVADECMKFYCDTADFLWREDNLRKIVGPDISYKGPRFRLTIAKAFELVAIFGPELYAQNPHRTVTPRKPFSAFDPGRIVQLFSDPMEQMAMISLLMEEQQETEYAAARAELVGAYLNLTPNELPGGGLQQHATKAITEALIKGRGVLWQELYQPPGAQHKLIGSFYDSVDNLFLDPDAESFADATWIARRCYHPIWHVERDYELPPESLEGAGSEESRTAQAEHATDDMNDLHRRAGQTNDLMVYYKIWSKTGMGSRLTGMEKDLKEVLEQFGDYCYLVVAPDVPYPLNLPSAVLPTAEDDELMSRVRWPVPYWADDEWPCAVLDFYEEPRKPWPIAPLKPAMGELKFLNIMFSHLCNRIWMSSRDFIAVAKSAAESLKASIESGSDQAILEIESVHGSINDVVQFLQQPQTNMDAWKILDAVMQSFERRTGLSDLVYGYSAKQFRSAEESAVKNQQISIRPDYMSKRVEQWLQRTAHNEAICLRLTSTPEDIGFYLGKTAAVLWQRLVLEQDVERVLRELDYRIEPGTARRPNKQQDIGNVNDALPILLPLLDGHAAVTGDTAPLNDLITQWGKAIDMDVSGMLMQPRIPPPPPEMAGAAEGTGEGGDQGVAA